MASKVAVVVMVKDEVADFSTWLAWYKTIGFDTAIIFDDNSTDGTSVVAQAALQSMDVRICKPDYSHGDGFERRQLRAYQTAIADYGSEFEWMAFFDLDEFLFLPKHPNIKEFLSQPNFQKADAIAVNWCMYGSNGHVLKPKFPIIQAFTRHSSVNPEVKSDRFHGAKTILRPESAKGPWPNPHGLQLSHGYYVDAAGSHVAAPLQGWLWQVDWTNAKLMHFMIRSMEHYVERLRRRYENGSFTGIKNNEFWNNDTNEIEDLAPLIHLSELYKNIFSIDNIVMNIFKYRMIDHHDNITNHIIDVSNKLRGDMIFYSITTHHDTLMCVNPKNGALGHADTSVIQKNELSPVIGVSDTNQPRTIHLYAPRLTGPLRATGEQRISDILGYHVVSQPQGHAIGLRSPVSGALVCASTVTTDACGEIAVNRFQMGHWEQFTLHQTAEPSVIPSEFLALTNVDLTTLTVIALTEWLSRYGHSISSMALANAIGFLPNGEKEALRRKIPSPLPMWV